MTAFTVRSSVTELTAKLNESIAEALAPRVKVQAEADDAHAALAVAFTPVPYRCRLEWVEQDGIRGRVMACRWGR